MKTTEKEREAIAMLVANSIPTAIAKKGKDPSKYKIEHTLVNKPEKSYYGIVISEKGSMYSAIVKTDGFAEAYYYGDMSLDDMVNKAAECALENLASFPLTEIPDVSSYENIRELLAIELADPNMPMLNKYPHTIVNGFAAFYLIEMNGLEMSAAVTHSLLESWGISLEELHKEAVKQNRLKHPLVIRPLFEVMAEQFAVMAGLSKADAMEMFKDESQPNLYCTSSGCDRGAACLAYPEFLDTAAKVVQKNFFILPSSKHEVLLMPAEEADAEIMAAVVAEVNENEVAPENKLSDTVYFYDIAKHVLKPCN